MNKVLIIGWDAADWKLIDPLIERGEMPVLSRFLEQGVMSDITTLQPVLSPLLWNSIATGKRADKHGILDFTEVSPNGDVRPVTSTSRKVKALWNILSQSGLRSHVVGWFGGHPAEPITGASVSDMYPHATAAPGDPWPLMRGVVHPERLADQLGNLRMRPDEITGEVLQLFVPRAADVDQDKDRRLAIVAKLLAECFSIHAAATWLLEHEPWDFGAVYYNTIDHFSHSFMAYHPPLMDGVPQRAFELYKDVVNSAYRLHDLLLGRLLHLAGPDTTVILLSDHGFHSDLLRPRYTPMTPSGPTIWHRPLGIFCMRGQGIKRDERIYGASLLDITPTVLTLFGLPIGQDMEGRVLTEAFEQPPELNFIPSWEAVKGNAGMHTGETELEPEQTAALLEQFIALGYVNRPDKNRNRAAAACRLEQNWNLARVYIETARYADALELLEGLHSEASDRSDIAFLLARCQARLGLLDEAEETVAPMLEILGNAAFASLIRGNIAFDRGRYAESLQLLLEAEKAEPRLPDLHLAIGNTYLRSVRYPDAERTFERALEIDPHSAQARLGLALTLLRQRRYDEAAGAAILAVGLQHHLPMAHFYLGSALVRLQMFDRAIPAFEMAVRQRGPLFMAHRWLARLYKNQGNDERSAYHFSEAIKVAKQRKTAAIELTTLQEAARARAEKRAEPAASSPKTPPVRPDTFTVVSGLPRSGTSLMMQMLKAGGLEIMTDHQRVADHDNPEGYYEWEEIKRVGENPDILNQVDGKPLKIVSALIPSLPPIHRYRVIFMNRPIDEVVASQTKMIDRRKTRGANLSPDKLAENLSQHRTTIRAGMAASQNFEVLEVDYPDLIVQPAVWVEKVNEFLGGNLDVAKMAACVKPDLHRNRAAIAAR
ncbi:MAG TPA: alkaline phosphatase family protein [Chthoniobacterales bacterium]|jgi:predicted AlkP superfamily phosphohydrolase/phosphomutase/tetratricopeptide (TPR) repeat protein